MRIFRPENPLASARFEPAILYTRGQRANHQTAEAAVRSIGHYTVSLLNLRFFSTFSFGTTPTYQNSIPGEKKLRLESGKA
jgi:hypothetical protein